MFYFIWTVALSKEEALRTKQMSQKGGFGALELDDRKRDHRAQVLQTTPSVTSVSFAGRCVTMFYSNCIFAHTNINTNTYINIYIYIYVYVYIYIYIYILRGRSKGFFV